MAWRKVMIAAVTGSGDWRDSTLSMPGFSLGMDYQDLGVPLLPGEPVRDAAVMQMLQAHDYVILQHWPPPEFVTRIEANGKTQVLFWVPFEAISAQPPWDQRSQGLWWVARFSAMQGTRLNRWGNLFIDAYEGTADPAWPYKPHTIAIDTNRAAHDFVVALDQTWSFAGYDGVLARRLFFDSVLPRPYFGTATNAPSPLVDTGYKQGWTDLLSTLRKVGWRSLWGNCGAKVLDYPWLDTKLDERFFAMYPRVDQAQAALRYWREQDAARLVLNVETNAVGQGWASTGGGWEVLYQEFATDPIMVVTARTGHWCFVPPVEWR